MMFFVNLYPAMIKLVVVVDLDVIDDVDDYELTLYQQLLKLLYYFIKQH